MFVHSGLPKTFWIEVASTMHILGRGYDDSVWDFEGLTSTPMT